MIDPVFFIVLALAMSAPLALKVEGRYIAMAMGFIIFAFSFFVPYAAFFFVLFGVMLIAMALDHRYGALGYALGLSAVSTALAAYAYFMSIITPEYALNYAFAGLAALAIATTGIYGLLASGKERENVEGALKYLIFSAVGKTLMVMGFALALYAAPTLGWLLLSFGFIFELGLVPAHLWMVDAFSLSTPKGVAALVLFGELTPLLVLLTFFRVVGMTKPAGFALLLVALASMTYANIAALTARTFGRMLAYSSIAHMSYAVSAVALVAYFGNRAVDMPLFGIYPAFTIAATVAILEGLTSGLAKAGIFNALTVKHADIVPDRRVLSGALNVLSLLGLPPLLGFWPKLLLVLLALAYGQLGIALIVILNSAIATPYYLRVFRMLAEAKGPSADNATSVLTAALSTVLGVAVPLLLSVIIP
ncbi:proton-conducting transporter membrane subunit [Thermoproteus tenax]|uniref:NADH dehydrogenase I chain N n=1 Tax=Thermoproteus tenax (strain ATCC 35583 / DSM 2078 / JCM 9277 / NBRC 100435 / Kra 1) TaxID=768679 RepID=G4RNT4_THETK|nr:proton-conducting transporter membrane subunit [Thermoproteus tenax]CCC81228.1 NADH dehydrogenase I chain N [Thermoproteus tenax Kra 1]